MYASCGRYDFVVYLLVDTSRDKKIREAAQTGRDRGLITRLWEEFNIHFSIV